jgi:hypothetical protein
MKEQVNSGVSHPKVIIDKSLERYRGRVLFPEQLRKVNDILAKSLPPKGLLPPSTSSDQKF